SRRTQLTHLRDGEGAIAPAWSPDGRQIAITLLRQEPDETFSLPSIEVMNADGTGRHRLTDGLFPDWSPDGKSLLITRFEELSDGSTALYVIDPKSGKARGPLRKDAMMGVWSPDGRRIAFVRLEDGIMTGLFAMNADGSSERRLGADEL